MKKLIERITRRGGETPPRESAAPQEMPEGQLPTESAPGGTTEAPPKLPPELPLFFMLSHLDDDGPVRLDGVKLGVCEVMGLELDEPKLGAFAGALNALDFPAQLLIRQHAPRLERLRDDLREAQPKDLPPQTREAAESLQRLLTDLEARDGILDRRFYAVCEFGRIDDLRGLLARAGLSVHPLKGRQLRMFLAAAALGGSPTEFDEESPVEVEIGRRDIRVGGSLVRSLHLGKWPRSLAPGFLQGLMAAGAPMDLSVHVGPIPAEQAARTLEWQKVRFESAQSLSFKRGRTMSPEAEIALEDITRLRDEVQRGRERLFHASLSVTLHAKDEASLREMTQRAKAHFAATLGKLDNLAFRQREGLLSTLPLALNAVAEWRSLDTSSIARLFPFSPPDLDTRSGTLYGIDMRACSPVVYDPWDGTHMNANTAVLARSGSGKSFATKLGVLRGITRGITAYVIDPEGEYADMARAAGGRVLSPGVPGEGMNPFVIDKGDSEEMLQRIGSLQKAHRGDGGRESRGGAPRLPRPRPGGLLRPAPRAHRLPRFLQVPAGDEAGDRGIWPACCSGPSPPAACATCSPTRATTCWATRPWSPSSTCGSWSRSCGPPPRWSAPRRCGPRQPRTPSRGCWSSTRCGASCSTPRARPSWCRWRSAPASTGWGCSSSPRTCRTSSPRTPPAPSPATREGRCSRTPPSSCCSSRTPPPSGPSATPSTCPRTFSAGSCRAPGETGCCCRRATASPSASRPPRRRRRSSSGRPDAIRERNNTMKLNPKEILFGNDTEKKPVLLTVTPPRAGERTLLGVENMLGSIAVPEPFSLELAGDMDGVTLMARCLDDEVVRGQLSAHYPQARIRKVDPDDDPLRMGEGEQAWSMTLRADGPEYVPLRTFRDDDLLDPGSDPLIALMGALSNINKGERVVARLMLRSLGPDWSQGHLDKAHKRPGMEPREPAYTFQTKPLQMDGITMAVLGLGALAALKGYLWVQDGEIWKAALLGIGSALGLAAGGWAWHRWKKARKRVEDPLLIKEKVSRVAFDAELQVTAILPAGTRPQRAGELLGPVAAAYRHFDNPAGARFKVGKVRPTATDPDMMHPAGPGLFGGRSVLGVREIACLWHPPGAGDETPLVERSGARALLPFAKGVRGGALVGDTTAGKPRPIRFPDDLLRRHHLYVARTRMGKSTLMHHLVTHKMREKAEGRDNDAIVVVDPHADLVAGLLRQVPESLIDRVRLIDLADQRRAPGINLLDTRIFTDRDRTADSVVRVAKGLWEQWGPRMQSILEQTVKTLHEANEHPETDEGSQHTILDGLKLLSDRKFRDGVLKRIEDPYLLEWWARDFGGWHQQYRAEALAPVQTRLSYYASSKRARAILGQRRSTIDLRDTILGGGILLVSTAQGAVGRDVSALVGASLLNLVDSVIREQESVSLGQRRGALVVVDEMQSMPGVDYESMLSELGKFGASFVLATQSLAKLDDLSRTMRDTLLANVGCLAVFQVAGSDARQLVWELGKERVTEDDITSLPVHHCYVSATVGIERMPAFSMMVRKPEDGDPAVAAQIRSAASAYTLTAQDLEDAGSANQKKVRDFKDRAADLEKDGGETEDKAASKDAEEGEAEQ